MVATSSRTTESKDAIFNSDLSRRIFYAKFAHAEGGCDTWEGLSKTLAQEVCGGILPQDTIDEIARMFANMEAIPGGRYLYYAGRPNKFYNNCYCLISQEDSREDWAETSWKIESCLLTGGGIGNDYSVYRAYGEPIKGTGGYASGPITKMQSINEIGRGARQGGGRRAAMYASLNWAHPDANRRNEIDPMTRAPYVDMMNVKDWDKILIPGGNGLTLGQVKADPMNGWEWPAPLDYTNISLNYDNQFISQLYGLPWQQVEKYWREGRIHELELQQIPDTFVRNIEMGMRNGEPGLSLNFFDQEDETGRNACTEITTKDDSDVCNLGSANMARIHTLERFRQVVSLLSLFLLCGTLKAKLPYEKVYKVREKNRRLGLGLMGIHEWMLQRGYRYEMTPELHQWMEAYRDESEREVRSLCAKLGISTPVAFRAIAPTGTISLLAGTTQGVEPMYAAAYKRYYYRDSLRYWQYNVEPIAVDMANRYGIDPDSIETAMDLAVTPERRVKFQFEMQRYVDQGISSTLNLPAWGTELNNPDRVQDMARIFAKYAIGLRGITMYPDGARGGQPIEKVSYHEAMTQQGVEFLQTDICDLTGGGSCGA